MTVLRPLAVLMITLCALTTGCEQSEPTEPTAAAPPPSPMPVARPAPMSPVLIASIEAIGQGRFDEARAAVEAYRIEHPDDAQAVLVHALAFHRERRYAEAAPLFELAIAMAPDDARAHHFLGYCRFYLGDLDGARASFLTHLDHVPLESDSHFGVGLVDLEEGQLDAAEARFDHAIALIRDLEESNPRLYAARALDLGKCYARLGDIAFARTEYERAKELYIDAVAVNPNLYPVYHSLSQTYRRLGNEAEADRMTALHAQLLADRQRRLAERGLPQ